MLVVSSYPTTGSTTDGAPASATIFSKLVRVFQKLVRVFQKLVRVFQKSVRIFSNANAFLSVASVAPLFCILHLLLTATSEASVAVATSTGASASARTAAAASEATAAAGCAATQVAAPAAVAASADGAAPAGVASLTESTYAVSCGAASAEATVVIFAHIIINARVALLGLASANGPPVAKVGIAAIDIAVTVAATAKASLRTPVVAAAVSRTADAIPATAVVAISATRDVRRALVAATVAVIVATVPSAAHAEVLVASGIARTVEVTASFVEAAPVVHPPAVASTIGDEEVGTAKVEIVAVWVAGIDAEVPVACIPEERAVEIGGCTEHVPLPGEQNIAEVQVAALPVGAEHIILAGDAHEVVEIYFVGCLVLSIAQVQLVGHLVGEEEGLVACLFVGHCICLYCYRQHGNQGKHHLLHSRMLLKG